MRDLKNSAASTDFSTNFGQFKIRNVAEYEEFSEIIQHRCCDRCLPLAAACRWPTSSLDVQRDLPSCVFGLSPVIAACHRVIAKMQNRVHTKEKVYTLKEG